MASKTITRPLTWTQAERVAKAFKPSENMLAARVRALIPHVAKSAATIVDEVWDAYEGKGVTLAWAFGESTIQTSLNVARAYVSLPESARKKLSTADETAILAGLVTVARTRETIPVAGRKTGMAGGRKAMLATIAAMAKAEPSTWVAGVDLIAVTTARAEAADRRGRRAGKATLAGDDETMTEIAAKHNERAADVRTGDEAATKNNDKAHRASKHERKSTGRDPLEPTAETQAHMPAESTGKAPAQIDPLRDASVDALIKELQKRLVLGYVPTRKQDEAMTELATTWEARVTEAPASKGGSYLERMSAPVSEALAGASAA